MRRSRKLPTRENFPATCLTSIVLLAIPLACGSGEKRSDELPTFVGLQACESCHPQETGLWRGSHHDLAMQVADETTVLGDFDDVSFTHFGITSEFFRRNGKFFVRSDGPDGELHAYEIAYTFGVEPLQQYLIGFPDGRYQVLGLAWDARAASEGGQRWFHLYPDEKRSPQDPLHWTQSAQNWNFMCAACHSTGLRKRYQQETDRYDTTWVEIDVSCEACHGPGSAHAAWARQHERGTADGSARGLVVPFERYGNTAWTFAPGASIAAPSPAPHTQPEIETCARCHSRRALLHEGPADGKPILESHRPALLDEGLYYADGQIREEVYVYGSFLQSKMYARGVACSDCHDPHGLKLRSEGNALCGSCHLPARYDGPEHHHHEQDSPGSACVACHMPNRTYMLIDDRHDHSFRVPRPRLSAQLGTPDACTGCHLNRSSEWAADTVEIWYGPGRAAEPHFGQALQAGRRGLDGAEELLAALAEDAEQAAIVRATALRLLRDHLGPRSAPVVGRALGHADPLLRMAALDTFETMDPNLRLRLAQPILSDPIRGVRIQAARALASVPAELWPPDERDALTAPLAEYRRAQQQNADRPESHLNLGLLELQLGEAARARREYETALRLDPAFVPAYVNLADLARVEGRDDEGERILRQALELAPASAEVQHALGLLLVRGRRIPEALEALRRAAELAPDRPRYAYVYRLALEQLSESTRSSKP